MIIVCTSDGVAYAATSIIWDEADFVVTEDGDGTIEVVLKPEGGSA